MSLRCRKHERTGGIQLLWVEHIHLLSSQQLGVHVTTAAPATDWARRFPLLRAALLQLYCVTACHGLLCVLSERW